MHFFLELECERIFIKMHDNESRFVIGLQNRLFAAAFSTFHPRNFTGWGSEGVYI